MAIEVLITVTRDHASPHTGSHVGARAFAHGTSRSHLGAGIHAG